MYTVSLKYFYFFKELLSRGDWFCGKFKQSLEGLVLIHISQICEIMIENEHKVLFQPKVMLVLVAFVSSFWSFSKTQSKSQPILL